MKKQRQTSTLILSEMFFFEKQRGLFISDAQKLSGLNFMSKLNGFLVGFRIKSVKTGNEQEFVHVKSHSVYDKRFFEEFFNNELKLKARIFW